MPELNKLGTHPFLVLNKDEIEDPKLVFERLFEYAHFSDLRKSLEETKYWLVNKTYPYSEDKMQHENTLYFFEKLQALLEAAYILKYGS